MPPADPDRRMKRRIWWLAVLAANLPVPLYFGLAMVEDGAWAGLVVGIGAVWLLGHLACRWAPWLASAAIVGGSCVAASQLWPVLQVVAGVVGMQVGAGGEMKARGAWEGFLATIVTGGALLTVSAIVGSPLWAVVCEHNRVVAAGKPKVKLDELA